MDTIYNFISAHPLLCVISLLVACALIAGFFGVEIDLDDLDFGD